MKNALLALIVAGTSCIANAQTLPKPSPGSEVEQTVGATEIEIEYSRPGVKGRTIFGGLVPYDKVWRFGANSATQISTEHSLFIGGVELKAGTYSMFAIPGKETWTIIFNSDLQASEATYTEKKDVLRVISKPVKNSFTESFTLGFDNLRDTSASIVVLWENTKVSIPFTVDTKANSIANIEAAEKKGEDLNSVYNNAANFYYSTMKDNTKALEYVNKSIALDENYRNLFLKARIISDTKKDEAVILAKKAYELAKKTGSKGYQNFISGTIEKWTKKD